VALAIATGKPISLDRLQQIDNGRARIQLAWQLLKEITLFDDDASPVKTAMAEARHLYFGAFQPRIDAMRQMNDDNFAYGVTVIDWINETNPQIDSFLGILRAAADIGEQRSLQIERDAFLDLLGRIAGILIALAGTAACVLVAIKRVTNPLARLCGAVRNLASGNLDSKVSYTKRTDEIGELARAVDLFKLSLIENQALSAARDAERNAKETRAANLEALARSFEANVTGLVSSFEMSSSALEKTSQELSVSAEQSNQRSSEVADTAQQTTANIQAVATATEALARSASDIGARVRRSAEITRDAVAYARDANSAIEALAAGAEQIEEVVKLISGVAAQTNLLALNATIEAARAGEAGRGFSVVASEVKTLSAQTAKATEQIGAQIQQIQNATRETVATIRKIGATIQDVNKIATDVSAAVHQQQAATNEIAQNISETASGTEEVTQHIGQAHAAAAQTGRAANQLLESATAVARNSSALRREVETFLSDMRKAS
jgi:methyl-accepting chemotaxis protein